MTLHAYLLVGLHFSDPVYLADILSAFCIPMGCEGTLIDLPFI